MSKRTFKTKFLAGFVAVFVCLNAAGLACLAYCKVAPFHSTELTSDSSPVSHCDKQSQTDDGRQMSRTEGSEIECCAMSLGFVGVPIEKDPVNLLSLHVEAAAEAEIASVPYPEILGSTSIRATEAYRGPPLLDRRVDRLRYRVFRI